MKCSRCSREISEDESFSHQGQVLCEDCYIEVASHAGKCDPWATYLATHTRESLGMKGTEGLTELQKKVYEFIKSQGKATREEVKQNLSLSEAEMDAQLTPLMHSELVKECGDSSSLELGEHATKASQPIRIGGQIMRIIALSDIHGNLPALQAVFAAIHSPPDMIIVAGDLVGFGPQPAEVVDLLRSKGCSFVKGNVDDYVSNPPSIERLYSFADQELSSGRPFRPLLPLAVTSESVEWTRSQLGHRLGFLTKLPFSISVEPSPGRQLKVVHANPRDLERPILQRDPDSQLLPMLSGLDCDILVFGHSHNPFQRSVGGTLLVNVASLGFPTDGRSDAPYADITFHEGGWHIEQHRVAYDTEATASLIEASTMPNKDVVLTLLRTARRVKDG